MNIYFVKNQYKINTKKNNLNKKICKYTKCGRSNIMSKADDLFVQMCKDIIENGYSTEGEKVRP